MHSRAGYQLRIDVVSLAGSRERTVRLMAIDFEGQVVELAMGVEEWRTVKEAVDAELRKADARDDIIDIGARALRKELPDGQSDGERPL